MIAFREPLFRGAFEKWFYEISALSNFNACVDTLRNYYFSLWEMVNYLIKHLLGSVITALGQKCVPSKGGDVLKANTRVFPIMGQHTVEKLETSKEFNTEARERLKLWYWQEKTLNSERDFTQFWWPSYPLSREPGHWTITWITMTWTTSWPRLLIHAYLLPSI